MMMMMLLVKVNGVGVKKYGLMLPFTVYLATICQLQCYTRFVMKRKTLYKYYVLKL